MPFPRHHIEIPDERGTRSLSCGLHSAVLFQISLGNHELPLLYKPEKHKNGLGVETSHSSGASLFVQIERRIQLDIASVGKIMIL